MIESQQLLQPLNYIPADIYCAQDYELLAQGFIPALSYAYAFTIAGGSGRDQTLAANQAAFSKYPVVPRILRDLIQGNAQISLLGKNYSHPIFLAPVAYQKLAHPQGELDTARAADATDTCMIPSTLSSYSLEEIARVGTADKWFQLYFQPSREATLGFIETR
ncbi:alpha-hydroxy-acid oxidizing protein [Cellvibrio sp.]|uniref:alpha-hydroxy-acid oxidizing protein n=1 Tax=Cellvibrio sp. TaxID=1965322 RepID=UPI0039647F4A